MLDDGRGVIHGAGDVLFVHRVNVLGFKTCELWDPALDVQALRVKPLLLEPRVKDAEVRLRITPG